MAATSIRWNGPSAAYFTPPEPRQISDAALTYAVERQLGDIDTLSDFLHSRSDAEFDNAERMLRIDSRIAEAPLPTVLCGAFVSAYRDDAAGALKCLQEVLKRYLKDNEAAIRAAASA